MPRLLSHYTEMARRDVTNDAVVETILTGGSIDWLVHGWYERDLRAALATIDSDAREEAP